MANFWSLYFFIFLFISPIFAQSDTYIVHMNLASMPKAFSSPHHWYTAATQSIFMTAATESPTSSKILYTYDHVVHGFTATLSPSELQVLKSSPGYVNSFQDSRIQLDTTRSQQFLGLKSDSGIWPVSSYGKDVIIGVVDTGVWPESKSFSEVGMTSVPARWKGKCAKDTAFNTSFCNKKIIGARFFNKGLLANNPDINVTWNSARDDDGHGSHCAGIAAGNNAAGASFFGYATGVAKGVAPRARLAIYKAAWDVGTFTSDVVAALDAAIADGVDVISMSLGRGDRRTYEDPYAIATYAAMEKGIFVALSAGNRGPDIFTVHNSSPWVLTVAAGSIDRTFSGTVTLSDGTSAAGEIIFTRNLTSLPKLPLVLMNSCDSADELNKIGYKIAICLDRVGSSSVDLQYQEIGNSNVAGGIIITNTVVHLQNFIYGSKPVIIMNLKDGEIIKNYINRTSNPTATMTLKNTILGIKKAPMAAEYSSRGPSSSNRNILKPDLMAPGSLILAAWPENKPIAPGLSISSNFNLLYGTSMACPHAAGVAALLKSVYPDWSPAAIRSAMMTTADSLDNTLNSILDSVDKISPANPLAIGAGFINPNRALNPGLIYDLMPADYLNYLCGLNFTAEQIQIITKKSHNCTKSSLDLNYPSFIGFFNDTSLNSTVREFRRTLTNVGEGAAIYDAKVTPIPDFSITVIPKKLVFSKKFEKLGFRVILKGPRIVKKQVDYGYLKWVESKGKYEVKSPIVAYGYSE